MAHRASRSRLFSQLEERAYESTFVFIGHRLADFDLRQLMQRIDDTVASRPRFYLVRPNITDPERRFWESRRVTSRIGGFQEFLTALHESCPSPLRAVQRPESTSHPILRRFITRAALEDATVDFLERDADYVTTTMPGSGGSPADFYRGIDLGWAALEQNLDVRRPLVNTVLTECVLPDEAERATKQQLYVIKAEAGSGKTVALRRIAWEASRELNVLCLYIRNGGELRYGPIRDIHRGTGERLFLFVDDAADRIGPIRDVLSGASDDGTPVTIITAERLNEWNIHCERLDEHVTDQYTVHYLSHKELAELVDRLEFHHSLGVLANKPRAGRITDLAERAGRQLLVALHDATSGRPFEEIIASEYDAIDPPEAKELYLSLCTLNRLCIPVRAGLISRVHNIPFIEFSSRLFKPLEHVVEASTR